MLKKKHTPFKNIYRFLFITLKIRKKERKTPPKKPPDR